MLSFENPNYILGNRLDDALNSNNNAPGDQTNTTGADNATLDGGLAALGKYFLRYTQVNIILEVYEGLGIKVS